MMDITEQKGNNEAEFSALQKKVQKAMNAVPHLFGVELVFVNVFTCIIITSFAKNAF